ncbi:hypothetical protein KEM48_012668 [Puccinia striiformis f. sp. tritici PST-130]|nr:hypothetical protein KEM48_012668 [Puccinia striiformis f. sp. tritici PST-130]
MGRLLTLKKIHLLTIKWPIFQVYALLKNTIENKRHIKNPPIIVEILGMSAACASFLAEGLQAEMQACAAKNVDA